jgi:uncharacterized membrane protein YphA (DoxX/SURF4 family)
VTQIKTQLKINPRSREETPTIKLDEISTNLIALKEHIHIGVFVDILEIVGRVLFSLIFIGSAFGHFKNADGMAGYAKSKGLPAPKLTVQVSGLVLLVGGVLTIIGNPLGLIALIIFLVPTAIIMHPFWKETDAMAKMGEQTAFLKDIALAGAALVIYVLTK